jgi:hypothetical protein
MSVSGPHDLVLSQTLLVDERSLMLAGIEIMHMIRKGQLTGELCPSRQFYALAE